jgi:GNAT superfamily N-acetyltransferase
VTALAQISAGGATYAVRRAAPADVVPIVELTVADQIGTPRDDPSDPGPYLAAFEAIDADPAHLLVVATDGAGDVVATLQLTFIPGIARRGGTRAQIEAFRVRPDLRSRGIGGALIEWAVEQARERGCALVQLTSNKARADAHRFYGRLGFSATHEGFKLKLVHE